MKSQQSPFPVPELTDEVILAGLQMLLDAYRYATATGRNCWEFAVEISELREAGLNHCQLRWMLVMELAEHANEVTRPSSIGREFRKCSPLCLGQKSCFVLTDHGRQVLLEERTIHSSVSAHKSMDSAALNWAGNGHPPQRTFHHHTNVEPRWDPVARELWVGQQLVKRFVRPAPIQELILKVFEEEGWPKHIDDPLPPCEGLDPRQRLHDAIKRLNRSQLAQLIRFHGNGSGEGIAWEMVGPKPVRTDGPSGLPFLS